MNLTTVKSKLAAFDAILIAGATASGKSQLALALAQALDGVIINSDSMQIYRDLRVLSARPTPEEEALVPHRLYGILDAEDRCSAGRWVAFARAEIAAARAAGRVPVVVGGTGLYFKALTDGLSDIPDISPENRARARGVLAEKGHEAFQALVMEVDPNLRHRLGVLDPQRLVRAYEVYLETGMALTQWQDQPLKGGLAAPHPLRFLKFVLSAERDLLYRRADERFRRMLEIGAVGEVERLLRRKLPTDLPVMKSVGVPELTQYLAGDWTLDQAREKAQTATRHLIKRQVTWIKSNMITWGAVFLKDSESLKEEIFTFICNCD